VGNLAHVIMPAIAFGVGRAAMLTRLLRASMLEVIRTEYITTARSKGLRENIVIAAELSRARHPTADAELGLGPQGERRLDSDQPLAVARPWFGHFHHGPGLQPL
jgi:hypothetical protein